MMWYSVWDDVKKPIERFLDQRDKEIELKRKELVVRTAEALINAGQVTSGKRMLERDL